MIFLNLLSCFRILYFRSTKNILVCSCVFSFKSLKCLVASM